MRSPSRHTPDLTATEFLVRLPPIREPNTKPPWSLALSRSALVILAYSSADSEVRIGTFRRSFKSVNEVVLFTQVFA